MLADNASAWSDSKCWTENWESITDGPSGGQASTKKVRNKLTGKTAFLKILNRQKTLERRFRFFREATAYDTHNLETIPKLLESNAHRHNELTYNLYIVTELIEGQTVTELVDNGGPVPLNSAIEITKSIVNTLEYCHKQSWVHRDLKPDNIIIRSSDSKPVILDFGLAYVSSEPRSFETEQGQEIGNRFLKLPEFLSGSDFKRDERSDLTFAGAILFYLVTGEPPYTILDSQGKMPHQNQRSLEAIREAGPTALNRTLQFFDKSFANRLVDRFQNPHQMYEALELIITESQNEQAETSDSALKFILQSMEAKAVKELSDHKIQYDRAIRVIRDAHSEIAVKIQSVWKTFYTGYVNYDEGQKYTLGFSHIANQSHRYAPLFLIQCLGSEYTVTVDGRTFYRTPADLPNWTNEFKDLCRDLFLQGLKSLIEGSEMPFHWSDFFLAKPRTKYAVAKQESEVKDLPLLIISYDEKHESKCDLERSLGYFMEYAKTKELVNSNFVVCVSSEQMIRDLLPSDLPIEALRIIVVQPDGTKKLDEKVYANPDEGLKRIERLLK